MELNNSRDIPRCRFSKRYQNYFNRINTLYFYGSLPVVKVYVAPLLSITKLSQKAVETGCYIDGGEYGLVGIDENDQSCIILDKGTSVFHPIITKQTVLHEAIHIHIHPYRLHGRQFKEEIRRIAALGALDNLI